MHATAGSPSAGLAGVISSVGHVLSWGLLARGGQGRRGSGVAAVAWIVAAPIIALLLQLAISRTRGLQADSSGAGLTGDPDALADALEKIEAIAKQQPYERAGPATAHLFIVNPLRSAGTVLRVLASTHPPTAMRVARLRALALRGEGEPRRLTFDEARHA